MPKFKRKELESFLQHVDVFHEPKIKLEQYSTTPHLASTKQCLMHNDIISFNLVNLLCKKRLFLSAIFIFLELFIQRAYDPLINNNSVNIKLQKPND